METFFFYLQLGFAHITDFKGYDHLLFIVAIACFYGHHEVKKLIWLLTAFTVGHSLTLGLAATGWIHFPSALAEVIIPFSILIASCLNVYKIKQGISDSRLIYAVICGFGLVHGLGFSTYFAAVLGQEESVVLPLLAFNIGLEVGQVIIVVAFLLLRKLVYARLHPAHSDAVLFLSGGTAMVSFILFLEHLVAYVAPS